MSLADALADGPPEREPSKGKREVLGKIAELLERSGIDVEDVGRVQKVNLHQGFYKDDDGQAQVVDMSGITLTPKWADGPEWPVVQPAAPTVVRPPKKTRQTAALVRDWKTTVCMGDTQFGFRLLDPTTGELDPFHDEAAIDVALQVTAALDDEVGGLHSVINLGDFLDLQQQSRFVQEAAFALTTQPAIDRGHRFLAQARAAAPDAKLVLLEGNHDRRMQTFITNNAAAAFGLRRANLPESWPVMSLPHVLRLDELGVEYIDAWPAGEWWINDNVRAIHGNKVRSNGSTANAIVRENSAITTIMGHGHRLEAHYRTTHARSGPIRSAAIMAGCLCRVDGAVPSVNSSTGIDGRPATMWEDWQQGLVVVHHTDDRQHITMHQIVDGEAVVNGQVFRAAA